MTTEALQARVKSVQEAADVDPARQARLLDLYRQSLANLENKRTDEEATQAYTEAARKAPLELEKIKERLDRWSSDDPVANLGISPKSSSVKLARRLDEELANLTAVEAKLAVLEARLDAESKRPVAARQQITNARAEVEQLAAEAGDRSFRQQDAQLAEATRWSTETRLEALQSRITMLDRELLTYPARYELLKAQRDEQAKSASRMRARMTAFQDAVNERRRAEVEKAIQEAQAALAGTSAKDPLVQELAKDNLHLVDLLGEQLKELASIAEQAGSLPSTAAVDSAFRSARRKLDLDGQGFGAAVGLTILEERRQFPSARDHQILRRSTSRSLGEVNLRLLETEEELRLLRDQGAYLDKRVADSGRDQLEPGLRDELKRLVATRRSLLNRAIANDEALQRRLYDLDETLQRLEERTSAYDQFLAERMLWVRTTRGADTATWAQLPAELGRYLAPQSWLDTLQLAIKRLWKAPYFGLLLVVSLLLVLRHRQLKAALQATGNAVGRIQEDRMSFSFKAVGYSTLLAAPLPLALAAVGGGLVTKEDAPAFANAVGVGLLQVALWLAFPAFLMEVFRPQGVAERHLGMDGAVLKRLRKQLDWFVVVAFPIYFVTVTSSLADEQTGVYGGALTLITFTALMLTVIALVIGIAHPRRGAVAPVLEWRSDSRWWRWRYVWFPLGVLLPLCLVILVMLGYNYTTQQFAGRLFQSLWFLTAVWLAGALARRWLLITSRRLAYEEAMQALQSADSSAAGGEDQAGSGREEGAIDEAGIDIVSMDANSRQLLNAVVVLTAALGLVGIWGKVLPAFSIFENIELWNRTVLINGIEQLAPVTLAEALLALLVGIGGFVLAANLPSLINIVLLKQGSVTASSRYTVQTLTNYAVIGITILLVLRLLGLNASQLGWAAAALGVGIGFGLQEIVANFICGLILLFERPVRVGDVVTIGESSGTVSKIRIRATTLRDWENKELVIPNKELITGRLLNWSLTDSVTRLFINVGIAYGSNVELAMSLMLDAAREHEAVLEDPAASVHFEQFGDSSLNLSLRAYVGQLSERLSTITALHKAIDRKFRDAGIVIPFPQRDVHLFRAQDGNEPA